MAADINKLLADITNANNEAFSYRGVEDDGSCNFDTPYIQIKLTRKERESLSDFLTPVGERAYKDCYYVEVDLYGQGNRRTTMARAAARSLKSAGYEASVRYMVD